MLSSGSGKAESKAAAPGTSTPPSSQCQSANVLSAVACELRVQLPSELGQVLVVAGGIQNDAELSLPELSRRLAKVVAGRFDAAESDGPLSLEAARARSTRAAYLLYLSPKLSGGHFEVTADLFHVPQSFWDRFKAPPGPLAHGFASRPLDAEIGAFLPVPPLVGQVQYRAKLPSDQVVALGCGDLDGDRAVELVVASRQEVLVGQLRDQRLVASRRLAWNSLSPIAGAPLKQPIAYIYLKPSGGLLVGSSDRRDLVRLDPQLKVVDTTESQLPWGDLGCAQRRGLGLAPVVVECGGQRSWERLAVNADLDTIAGGTFQTKKGLQRVVAARGLGESVVRLQDGDGREAQLSDAGAQLALADLDLDGVLEVISAKNTLERSQDVLRVHSWTTEGLKLRFELPVPTGVDALAVCPPDGGSPALVAVASLDSLWLLR